MTRQVSDGRPKALENWAPYPEQIPYVLRTGPLWYRTDDRGVEFAFLVDDHHCNMFDAVHGGMLCTFADQALGHLAWDTNKREPIVTVHLDVNFLAGAFRGELVECRPELVRKTRSLAFLQGTIMVGNRRVATASGIWKVIEGQAR